MKSWSEIKRKIDDEEEQRLKRYYVLRAIAGLLACIGFMLISPLIIYNSSVFIRWPIFLIVTIIPIILINDVFNIYTKNRDVNTTWIGIVLFIFLFYLCSSIPNYRLEKGYEKRGVIVDAEILDMYADMPPLGTRGWPSYSVGYCIFLDGEHYCKWKDINRSDYNRLYIGDSIPVIYNSRHPKLSRLVDYEPNYRINLFFIIERSFKKNDSTDLNENMK